MVQNYFAKIQLDNLFKHVLLTPVRFVQLNTVLFTVIGAYESICVGETHLCRGDTFGAQKHVVPALGTFALPPLRNPFFEKILISFLAS